MVLEYLNLNRSNISFNVLSGPTQRKISGQFNLATQKSNRLYLPNLERGKPAYMKDGGISLTLSASLL